MRLRDADGSHFSTAVSSAATPRLRCGVACQTPDKAQPPFSHNCESRLQECKSAVPGNSVAP